MLRQVRQKLVPCIALSKLRILDAHSTAFPLRESPPSCISLCTVVSLEPQCASQVVLVVKNPPASEGDVKRCGFYPWVGKIPWRRAWKPTPVFLPGESHGQRSLEGCNLQGCRESDMTDVTQQAACMPHKVWSSSMPFSSPTSRHLYSAGSHKCSKIGETETSPLGRPLKVRTLKVMSSVLFHSPWKSLELGVCSRSQSAIAGKETIARDSHKFSYRCQSDWLHICISISLGGKKVQGYCSAIFLALLSIPLTLKKNRREKQTSIVLRIF